MKRVLCILVVLLAGPALAPAQEPPARVAYYYKIRWGFEQEFERLFLKNHYPVLEAQTGEGKRIRAVSLYRPTFHGDGRADWNFLVVITFASWGAVSASAEEEAIARRMFPDQEAFRKEEQRRFEILEAHWDVPLREVDPGRR